MKQIILYSPCEHCPKCPHECNIFRYEFQGKKENAIPIPQPWAKECRPKLETKLII